MKTYNVKGAVYVYLELESSLWNIKCKCQTFKVKSWCDHLSSVFINNEQFIPDELKTFTGSILLEIPFFVNPLVQIKCLLTKSSNDLIEVFIDDVSIGWITLYDSLYDIRKLILEWVDSLPFQYPEQIKCVSTAHKVNIIYSSSGLARKMRLIDTLYMFLYDICYTCQENIPVHDFSKVKFTKLQKK